MKTLIIASIAAATLSLGTIGANAQSVSDQQERHAALIDVINSQHAPAAGSYAAATTSGSVSDQQERHNELFSVIRSQRPLL